jgi:hypothetical protein
MDRRLLNTGVPLSRSHILRLSFKYYKFQITWDYEQKNERCFISYLDIALSEDYF